MPTNQVVERLGDSKQMALKGSKSLEKRLLKTPDAKIKFQNFLDEYLQLGHMEEIKELISTTHDNSKIQYLLMQYVVREESVTTKFRVVFDASA
jgi:hypothetical protein